jgi:ubiquinone/menaquinone biosynthesis C-methylase UbiE
MLRRGELNFQKPSGVSNVIKQIILEKGQQMDNKQYFNKVSKQWDAIRSSFFSENVREKALAVAQIQPGKLAADIGTGTGFLTEGLVQRGLKVIAVDHSEAMLKEMSKKFSGLGEIDYRLGEAENLPIEGGAIDNVFANMYLHHVEHPAESIVELARILKKGGVLVLTDLDVHNFEFLRKEHKIDGWDSGERT